VSGQFQDNRRNFWLLFQNLKGCGVSGYGIKKLGLLSPDHDCTLAELLHRYAVEVTPKKRSVGPEKSRINKLCQYEIGNIRLSNLTSNDIAKFRDERLITVSGTTVVKDLLLISHAIKTAQREWDFKLPSNPVDNVNKPSVNKPRDRRLEEGEEERLLQACKQSSNHWFSKMGPRASGQKLGASSHDQEWRIT